MATSSETKFGVARGKKILGEGFATVEPAKAELAYYEKAMTDIGLDPDVRLVTFDVTTTVETSAPRAYVEPTDEVEENLTEEPAADENASA